MLVLTIYKHENNVKLYYKGEYIGTIEAVKGRARLGFNMISAVEIKRSDMIKDKKHG